ncbi:HAD family hydrolase [Paenibacillus filicis]|uniref:HAD family hydrolase n=1 Tax=Paenibacillus filicis TaxID=669464 RepID=A0ABU9DIT1_9BACL
MQLPDERQELWKCDAYLQHVDSRIENIRLLSLDIFDTLLLRACTRPGDVFLMTADRASDSGLLHRSVSAHEFRTAREAAERQARTRRLEVEGHDEVTLACIYEEMPGHWGPRSALLELELTIEREVCYLNPHVVSLLEWCRARGVKVALLSDMYLSSGQLFSLLAAAGLDRSAVDTLLVSGDHGLNKSTGRLFELLLSLYPGINREQVLHIGDNERADVRGAALASVASLHYGLVPEFAESPYHWESVRHPETLPQLGSLRKLAGAYRPADGGIEQGDLSDTYGSAKPAGRISEAASSGMAAEGGRRSDSFRRIGAEQAGPFLTALCDWVVDICLAEHRTEVHPLMREAVLLGPMLEQAARLRGVELRVVPLYVSRQATYLAALDNFGEAELDRLLSAQNGTVHELLRSLGLAAADFSLPVAADCTLRACAEHTRADGRTGLAALRDRLLQPDALAAVQEAAAASRRLLRAYISRLCGHTDRLVTVDIGFHGTIQRSLHQALADSRSDSGGNGSIHLLAAGGAGIGELRLAQGLDIRCYLGSSGENEDLTRAFIRSPAFIEELSMGGFGSTEGYRENEQGEAVPVIASLELSAGEAEAKQAFQEGALAFQRYYYAWQTGSPSGRMFQSQDRVPAREWFKPLHRLIDMPTPEETALLGSLKHRDSHFGPDSRICEPVRERWFAQGGLAFLDACSYAPSVLNVYWPQGALTLRMPYELYVHRLRQMDGHGRQALLWRMCRDIQALPSPLRESLTVIGSGPFLSELQRTAFLHRIEIAELVDPSAPEAWRHYLERLEQSASSGAPLPALWLASLAETEVRAWREQLELAADSGYRMQSRGKLAPDWGAMNAQQGKKLTFIDPFDAFPSLQADL